MMIDGRTGESQEESRDENEMQKESEPADGRPASGSLLNSYF